MQAPRARPAASGSSCESFRSACARAASGAARRPDGSGPPRWRPGHPIARPSAARAPLPVVREERGALVEPVGVRARRSPAPTAAWTAARRSPSCERYATSCGQRMLERVLRPRDRAPARRRTRPATRSRSASSSSVELEVRRRAREHRARRTPCRSPPRPGAPPCRARPGGRCAPRAPPARSPASPARSTGRTSRVGAALARPGCRPRPAPARSPR